jgi:aminoglycoside phosphotransferase (APT) family kinase protein
LIDEHALQQALSQQMPQLAGLPIQHLGQSGTDNHIFRLGEHYCIRLPRHTEAAAKLKKESDYLSHLQDLPLVTPQLIAQGQPFSGYVHNWAVYTWIDGTDLHHGTAIAPLNIAESLGGFLKALWACDATNSPTAGAQNNYRGTSLRQRDKLTRQAIHDLSDEFPEQSLLEIWETACKAAPHEGQPIWLHGDLHAANILAKGGALVGIIDWGLMGIGDPAVDLMPAWSLMDQSARTLFRDVTGVNEMMWQRGKGWSLSVATIAYAYYRNRPDYWLNEISLRTLHELLEDGAAPSSLDS